MRVKSAHFMCLVLLVLTATLVGAGEASAQAVPDAGTLRQQIEREQATPLPPKSEPLLPAAATPPLSLPEGMTIPVHAWRVTGNTLLDEAKLLAPLQSEVGNALGFADLQRAAQKVAQVYRDAGWIVRTYLPQQDVTEGTVTIEVVEAVFAGAKAEVEPAEAAPRVDPAALVATIDAAQAIGAPLNAAALDRGLLLANDLPGVSVSGALEPGERDRETALALRVRGSPLLAGIATLDNGGARSTGAGRANLSLGVASPLHLGDLWRLDAQKSQGTDYARAAASLPVGHQGLRIGLNASQLRYHLVGDDFAALDAHGRSTSTGANLDYPVLRSRTRNLYLSLAYDNTRYLNDANGAVQSNYRVEAFNVALNANLFDDLAGGGASNATLALRSGEVRQGTPDPAENPALAGHFNKLRYSVSRLQTLAPRWAMQAALSGQYSGRDLDSSERFYLGGPDGVRAYPVNEGSGSRGNLATAELRFRAHETLTLSGFFDAGHVSSPGTATPAATLKGAGAALAWSGPRGVDVRVTYAHRIGTNPNPTATGADQDGSHVRNRVWLQASLAF